MFTIKEFPGRRFKSMEEVEKARRNKSRWEACLRERRLALSNSKVVKVDKVDNVEEGKTQKA